MSTEIKTVEKIDIELIRLIGDDNFMTNKVIIKLASKVNELINTVNDLKETISRIKTDAIHEEKT